MKSEQQIKEQKEKLEAQLERIRAQAESIDKAGIEAKDLYTWAKCIESGKEALDWVLADDSYVNIVY